MCMLSYYPPNVLPDASRLANGCRQNQDGYGFAIVTPRRELIVERGMNAERMIDRFTVLRGLNPDGPAMFHSRWATSGDVDTSMCHPFPVGRDSRTVVAHNGVLFTPPKESRESDTAIFARVVLPGYAIDRPAKRYRLERYLNTNKIVILTTNPRYRKSAYLFGEAFGDWVDGEWHSNRDYLGGWAARYAAYDLDADDWAAGGYSHGAVMGPRGTDLDDCVFCWRNGTVDDTGVCVHCDSCQDCGDVRADCQCYSPRSAKASAKAFTSSSLSEIDPEGHMSADEWLVAWRARQQRELMSAD